MNTIKRMHRNKITKIHGRGILTIKLGQKYNNNEDKLGKTNVRKVHPC